MTGIGGDAATHPPGPCCRQELLDLADALIDTPDQHGWIRVLRARANGPRFAHLNRQRDTSHDWSREPTAGDLGIASPPQLTEADYRDPHCALCHPHSQTSWCRGG